jgi:5-methylcytosine-specific restriction protein B
MSIPNNITKEHLLKAISKIDSEGIPDYSQSQYYDVIFEGKRYPPKLIISYANLYANGEILDRNSFSGGVGTKSFEILTKSDFVIEKKPGNKTVEPKVWFVTQGGTFEDNKGMKFLWAPKSGKDKKARFYWDNVLKVKKGDIIFNYSGGLKGVSIAINDGYIAKNSDSNSPWESSGYRVDIALNLLTPPISLSVFMERKNDFKTFLSKIKNIPFDKNGKINEGYLYEFSNDAGRLIREVYGKNFGNEYIDDFFDSIKIPIPHKINNLELNIDAFYQDSNNSGLLLRRELLIRFVSSLLTKPFVILTGLSGSGKTKLAQAFSMWICENNNQYCIVPVGADWTNREPLLGFPNALQDKEYVKPDNRVLDLIIDANNNPDKPYFLILDEMNLSHVERYFADFLSVMESKSKISLHSGKENWNGVPAEIGFPKNLFTIGTVNIDETTYMFSPKVLDRANVIEFRVTAEEMGSYLKNNFTIDLANLESHGANMAGNFVQIAKDNSLVAKETEELNITLMSFFSELKKTGAEFGYRSASEILRFAAVVNKIESTWSMSDIIDAAIMQKLLPKVHGSRRKLAPVLETLGTLCLHNKIKEGEKIENYLYPKTEKDISELIKYPLSFEKISRMYKNLLDNGFTSYAEA